MATMDDLLVGTQSEWVDEIVDTVVGPNWTPDAVEVVSDWVDVRLAVLEKHSGPLNRSRLPWVLYDSLLGFYGRELLGLLVECRDSGR